MSEALPGMHYCIDHQGNHSHYAQKNCTVCQMELELNQAKAELSTLRAECERLRDGTASPVHIVFDGPPSHESGRFIEVEDSDGVSINAGRWEQRGDFWHLIIDFDTISKAIYAARKETSHE